VTDVLTPPPPVVAAPKRSFPWWIVGCGCSGCLLMLLIVVGLPVLFGLAAARMVEEGRTEKVSEATFKSIVSNSGPPPGFRVYWGNALPWPFSSLKGVLFVPENAQGDLRSILHSVDTFAILIQSPESARSLEDRDRLFRDGSMGPPPELQRIFEAFGGTSLDEMPRKAETGTLSGHRFPIRFAITRAEDKDKSADPDPNDRRRRRREVDYNLAIVDFTPPESKDTAITLCILRPSTETLTPSFLEEFCKNFKPGE
jgi:hypothetical protein